MGDEDAMKTAGEGSGVPARPCTGPEQEQFMDRLLRNEQEIASLRSDVADMTALVRRALVRRQQDREALRHDIFD